MSQDCDLCEVNVNWNIVFIGMVSYFGCGGIVVAVLRSDCIRCPFFCVGLRKSLSELGESKW